MVGITFFFMMIYGNEFVDFPKLCDVRANKKSD